MNGSFTSDKPHLNDLDVVSFLPYKLVEDSLEQLATLRQPLLMLGWMRILCCNIQLMTPAILLSAADEGYWHDLFRKTRPDQLGQAHSKAFVEILVEAL